MAKLNERIPPNHDQTALFYKPKKKLKQYAGLNPVAHMLEDILLEVDRNHDGKVSYSEFIIIWDKYLQRCIQEISVLELAFSFFDQDGSEEISLNEFRDAM